VNTAPALEEEYRFCPPSPPQPTAFEVQLYRDVDLQAPEDIALFHALIANGSKLLEALQRCIQSHELYAIHGLTVPPEAQPWLLEWILCDDASIRELNGLHRAKDEATDVLSFPLYESSTRTKHTAPLPNEFSKRYGGSLGSVVVSWEYALHHSPPGQRLAYVIERFIHGTLHVLGQHHDDEASFKRVLELQSFVLHALNLESTLLPYGDSTLECN
jgi:rRNA maturation RNase YbeY